MAMRNSTNVVLIAASFLTLVTLSGTAAQARDKEFGLLVYHVESYYHARRSHRFLMGFAGLVVRVWRPYGVKAFKIALFEDQNFSVPAHNDLDFPAVVRAGLSQGWQPLVRVYSRRDGEHTVIFARPAGDDMKLLVATVEPTEAVVLQMKINPDKLSKCIEHWTREDHRARPKTDEPQAVEDAHTSTTAPEAVATGTLALTGAQPPR